MDIKTEILKLAPTRTSSAILLLLIPSSGLLYAALWSLNEALLGLDSQGLEILRIVAIAALILVSSVFLNVHLILEIRNQQKRHTENIEFVIKKSSEISAKHAVEEIMKHESLEYKVGKQLGVHT